MSCSLAQPAVWVEQCAPTSRYKGGPFTHSTLSMDRIFATKLPFSTQ